MGLAGEVLVHAPLGGQLLVNIAGTASPEGEELLAVVVQVRLARLPGPCDRHMVPGIVRPAQSALHVSPRWR